MSYPSYIQTRMVSGKFSDIYFDPHTQEYKNRPTDGYVLVYPAVTELRANGEIYNLEYVAPQKLFLDDNGYFETELIVTTQQTINPNNWTYRLELSWLDIQIFFPVEDGHTTINVNDYISFPEQDPVIIQIGPPGRGITNISANGNTVTVVYTDGTQDNFNLSTSGMNAYVHTQTEYAEEWIVNHGLGKHITSVHINLGAPNSPEWDDLVLAPWSEVDMNTIKIFVNGSGQAIVS